MTPPAATVVLCPDSFKGSASATEAADWLAQGWRQVRPDDTVVALGQADGGEGTAEVVAAAQPGGRWHELTVCGPDRRPVTGRWYRHGSTATCDLAQMSGLPLMGELDPTGATTRGLGQVIGAAVAAGCTLIQVGLGGSASTDGGAGALAALGWSLTDADGAPVPDGGQGLTRIASLTPGDWPDEVEVLVVTDVTAPLLGPNGAAAVFGPQKGATADDIALLDAALAHWATVLGGDPEAPGAGAAGGVGYGFATALGARLVPGADWVAERTGLTTLLPGADLVVTGEGRFDATSWTGKVTGSVLTAVGDATRSAVVAGQVSPDAARPGLTMIALSELAGSSEAALADPQRWLVRAGSALAEGFEPPSVHCGHGRTHPGR
ncbi:MAG TPA: glycerate kinase [Candidatus Avipropionibacterium avicola]|uniref:Glycerate kinase n=1 Tax=Candidatus Avipropionibacterium avicola TaxID=2840701 RepID=A0A9D1GYY5_9ACTN|nr:glycerate kinase [Candidatus Avipropionibacterium avicola]